MLLDVCDKKKDLMYTKNFIAAVFVVTKELETKQMPISCGTAKQSMVHEYNGILSY